MPHTDTIPVSASVVSTGLGIRYIGNYAYAYSGLKSAKDVQTVLDFTTGSGLIVGIIQLNAPIDDDNPTVGIEATANISFNGISIGIIKASTDFNDNASGSVSQEVIIPPITKVTVTMDSSAIETDRFGSVVFTGRVYGAE
jgi:hypothetical protein